MQAAMIYTGSAIIAFWGVMHILKTKAALAEFGSLSADNRRILTMEWVIEGVTLCFLAVLASTMTATHGMTSAAVLVVRLAAGMLMVMAAVSLFTGARTHPLPYKLCPPIFAVSAVLFVFGSMG